jgi:hypothetical protein
MESYLNKLSRDYHRELAPPQYNLIDPKVLKLKLRAKDDIAPKQLTERYQSLISKLLYLASQLRVNVSFAVSYLARAISNLTKLHFQYAMQVVNYLYSTKALTIGY